MKLKQSIIIVSMLAAGACSGMEGIKSLPGAGALGSLGIKNPIEGIKKPDLVKGVDLSTAISSAKDLTKAMTLTDTDVKSMASQFSKLSDSNNKIASDSSRYAKRLKRLVAKHQHEDGLNLNFKVYMSPDVNAFAMADGTVRIYSGLMDVMRDQELLAVIGHEIGHVKLNHSLNKTKTAMLASAARKGVASMDSKIGALAATEVGGLFQKVITSQYSQAKEHDSDSYGLNFLLSHGYDGQGAVNAMYKLASIQSKSGAEGASFLSTHPGPRERAKRLAGLLEDAKTNPSVLQVAAEKSEDEVSVVAIESPGEAAIVTIETPSEVDVVVETPSDLVVSSAPVATAQTATLPTQSTMSSLASKQLVKAAHMQEQSKGLVSGYYLQTSAETDEALAQRKVALLRSEGMKVETQRAVVKGRVYIRILVGPYSSSLKAQKQSSFVIQTGLNDGSPFVKRVR